MEALKKPPKGLFQASSWPWVRTLLHVDHDQPDTASVHSQFDRVLDAPADSCRRPPNTLKAAGADVLPFTAPPREVWRRM